MDVIAGRKTQGEITGEILVNGHPKDQTTWARVVGYVEQMDIHSPQVWLTAAGNCPRSDCEVEQGFEDMLLVLDTPPNIYTDCPLLLTIG